MRRIAGSGAAGLLVVVFGCASATASDGKAGSGSEVQPAPQPDLVWQVTSPFRLYKTEAAFRLHERAFQAVHAAGTPIPADIVSRMERHLNAPDCRDPSTPASCEATMRSQARFREARLGWAAKTLAALCFDANARPRRYAADCTRLYGRRSAREHYILPEFHAVSVSLSPARLTEAGENDCVWTWRPRSGQAPSASKTQPCRQALSIERVPYAQDRAASGVSVEVEIAGGAKFSEPNVVVDDVLVVSLGDSFASGESNPDRPVSFGNRQTVYEPIREEMASTPETGMTRQEEQGGLPRTGILTEPAHNPRALPRRLLEDEEKGEQFSRASREFLDAFNRRNAGWFSPDCHRSQYAYPVRVSIQLALEDRHRAVTLVHLACSGAQVTEGLFAPQEAREGFERANSAMVPAQLDQLNDLICRDGPQSRGRAVTYNLPFFTPGKAPALRAVSKRWCAPERRRRPIDLVLLSVGGNDVGFGAIAAYTITESAGDIAPIAAVMGQEIRFGPEVAKRYLDVLDVRMQALKQALQAGFGVEPSRVVQTAYEPVQYDETGAVCGARPTLGLDVHPKFKIDRGRMQEASRFFDALLQRMQCITQAGHAGCRGGLATGPGTGFTLVTDHLPAFRKRGICARDPARAEADGLAMGIPRLNPLSSEYKPFHPAYYAPYAHRWRLFHTPNDAFLTANTHHEKIPLFDILQPVYAGLFSGAFHPTAEGHAIVADHVLPHARKVLGGSEAGAITATRE